MFHRRFCISFSLILVTVQCLLLTAIDSVWHSWQHPMRQCVFSSPISFLGSQRLQWIVLVMGFSSIWAHFHSFLWPEGTKSYKHLSATSDPFLRDLQIFKRATFLQASKLEYLCCNLAGNASVMYAMTVIWELQALSDFSSMTRVDQCSVHISVYIRTNLHVSYAFGIRALYWR